MRAQSWQNFYLHKYKHFFLGLSPSKENHSRKLKFPGSSPDCLCGGTPVKERTWKIIGLDMIAMVGCSIIGKKEIEVPKKYILPIFFQVIVGTPRALADDTLLKSGGFQINRNPLQAEDHCGKMR